MERLGLPALALTLSLGALVGLPFSPVLTGAAVLIAAIPVMKRAIEAIQQEQQLSGVFFALDPVLAIIINNGSAILAELNGLRPLLGVDHEMPVLHSKDIANLAIKQEELNDQYFKSNVELSTDADHAQNSNSQLSEIVEAPSISIESEVVVVSEQEQLNEAVLPVLAVNNLHHKNERKTAKVKHSNAQIPKLKPQKQNPDSTPLKKQK